MTRGRAAGSTGSGDPVRLTTSYHRSGWWWLSVICGGFAVVMALAILAVGAAAPASVLLTGSALGTGATARSYDILVSSASSAGAADSGGWTDSPAELDTLSGGITVGQYNAIRKLAGVDVAAPLTMVGYVPFTVSAPVTIPATVRSATPQPVTLTVRLRSDNDLSTVTWDDVTLANPDVRTSALSVRLSWTFELPLVAVDPVAEARLLHLNAAVDSGGYLPSRAAGPGQPVPMLIAGSIASDEAAQVTIDLPRSGTTAGTAVLTMASAYQQLVADAGIGGTIPSYWTAGPVSYQPGGAGQLAPEPVATELADVWDGAYQWAGAPADAGALDVPFRSLTEHTAAAGGATVRAVGVFDPGKVAGAPDTPSPYQPELLTGADPRTRQLLGGRPLAADGDPGAYPGSAASLVVPLSDIGSFTHGYAGVNDTAPIGVIRVRVAGAAGDTAASQNRIRAVAQEIVRTTGLHVQVVLGTTATTRVVDLPAGLHGRPALEVDEVWFRSGIVTTVWSGLGPDSIALAELELLAGELVIAWGAWRVMRTRRGELATLRALGWRRRQLGGQLLAEFALAAMVAVAAAVLAGYEIGAALAGRPGGRWLLLSVPAVIAVAIVETRRPLLRTIARALAAPPNRGRPRPALTSRRPRAGSERMVRRLLRTPARMLLSMFVIAVACIALSLEAAARWAFAGAATPWTERPVSWQGTVVDVVAVLLVAAMATFTVADLALLTLRDRAAELRTLRAIGWSAWDLVRLTLQNAVWPGLAGGLVAGAFVLLGGLAVAGSAPPRLVALSVLAAAVGVALSLLAASLPTIFSGSGLSANK
jgi:hypothetical protein